MLFNSYEFIFVFLPLTLVLYFLSTRYLKNSAPVVVLVLASLFFYGWWNPVYLLLIVGSILVNFKFGDFLSKNQSKRGIARPALILGVTLNLSLLGYFKYAGFIALNINYLFSTDLSFGEIILPLAISFFTFQQIAFLVDSYRGETRELNFLDYCLFVSFFPQLIAGPIVHHKEMMPQFADRGNLSPRALNFAIGISIFSLGLFKKVVIADGIAVYSTPVFDAALSGEEVHFLYAWQGSLAYTFQLYFDFSGYSDMAVGIARMFGIRLPVNFNSPYKAKSISEFWRRWHITLSRFLRDYVYISLGGNRRGGIRRYSNLLLTMLLGGLWHGAGWTFVIWGALHGLYLVVNHGWIALRQNYLAFIPRTGKLGIAISRLITFLAVIVGWVFFRAESLDAAFIILKGMIGLNSVQIPAAIGYRIPQQLGDYIQAMGITFYSGGGKEFITAWGFILILWFISFYMPNTLALMRRYRPVIANQSLFDHTRFSWRMNAKWAMFTAMLLLISIISLTRVSEFLYFQF